MNESSGAAKAGSDALPFTIELVLSTGDHVVGDLGIDDILKFQAGMPGNVAFREQPTDDRDRAMNILVVAMDYHLERVTTEVPGMARREPSLARGQHFIPRMHLAGFLPEARPQLLARFDKHTGEMSRVSVARAAVRNDYNTLPAETGHAPDALEQQFSNLETIVSPWIRQLRTVSEPGLVPLDLIARDGLAGYFAMLHVRSPAFREPARILETYLASVDADMTLAHADTYQARRRAAGDLRPSAEIELERIRDLERFRSGELFLEAHEMSSLKHLKLAVDEFRPRLVRNAWSIIRRTQPPYLVLGDQPVVMVGPEGELGQLGFASPDRRSRAAVTHRASCDYRRPAARGRGARRGRGYRTSVTRKPVVADRERIRVAHRQPLRPRPLSARPPSDGAQPRTR